MKKTLLLLVAVIHVSMLYSQQLNSADFLELSLGEKVDAFFNTYQDGHTQIGVSRFAGYIVTRHGYAVMPLLKERMAKANYFTYTEKPIDITLTLIAYIFSSLRVNSGRKLFNSGVPTFELLDVDIKWFFEEYMRRIDAYIISTHLIDETVMKSSTNIVTVFGYNKINCEKFGYPFFYGKEIKYCGNDLKRYYEERLGIQNLRVVLPFLE